MSTTRQPLNLPVAPVARRDALKAAARRCEELRRVLDDTAADADTRITAGAERKLLLDEIRAALRNRPAYTLRWTSCTGAHSYTSTVLAEIEVRGRAVARLEREDRATDIEIVVAGTDIDVTFDFECFRQ